MRKDEIQNKGSPLQIRVVYARVCAFTHAYTDSLLKFEIT